MKVSLESVEGKLITVAKIIGATQLTEQRHTTNAVIIGTIKSEGVYVSIDILDPFMVGQLVAAKGLYRSRVVLEYRKEFPSILARNGGFIITKARGGNGQAVRPHV